MEPPSDQFKEAIEELEVIKRQLDEANKAIKVLRERESTLKNFIGGFMKAQKIDNVQTKDGGIKVAKKKTVRKPSITKKILIDELPKYIPGGKERLDEILKLIMEGLETVEKDTLSLKLKKRDE